MTVVLVDRGLGEPSVAVMVKEYWAIVSRSRGAARVSVPVWGSMRKVDFTTVLSLEPRLYRI